MSQFNAPVRRAGGSLDVYSGLLLVAFLVLVTGVVMMCMRNLEHSGTTNASGGILTLVD